MVQVPDKETVVVQDAEMVEVKDAAWLIESETDFSDAAILLVSEAVGEGSDRDWLQL